MVRSVTLKPPKPPPFHHRAPRRVPGSLAGSTAESASLRPLLMSFPLGIVLTDLQTDLQKISAFIRALDVCCSTWLTLDPLKPGPQG